ncbi:adenosylcobinamide-GDP ribazoletransferase [Sinosporangium siamense]|uniref:Adenosylcobinamide-GDP ribazoletransferase n=1 Tax=Sinosporangium siamense TaxID=1367973 RepID=A0A919RA20_9ACTN|nr:adenosylcobinamide-GDP ribazoletransferase [Sinosporangium siamense]
MRLAFGLLSVAPVRFPEVTRTSAGQAMALAPVVGVALGGAAALLMWAAELSSGGFLPAALAVAVVALLTRGLHLDGLADLADGLGSGKPADAALNIMKKSDIGPFGVVTLVLTLLVQVGAAVEAGPYSLLVAVVTGRLALTWACGRGVPPARPDGLGAMVAGTVPRAAQVAATALAMAGAVLVSLAGGVSPVLFPAAVAAGLLAAWGLRRRAVRRLGGITGDVLGALVETATVAALLVAALL